MRAGNVPTAEVGPVLERLIHERWPDGGGHDVLAEKAGCDLSAIATIIEQQHPGVSFDLADRLFCALGQPMEHVGLADVYHAVKFVETCALPGCGRQFSEYHRGGKPKRYCSRKCQDLGRQVKNGRKATGMRLRQRGKCLKGHRMNSEDRQCRICRREQRMWRKQNDPDFAAREREKQRLWVANKRARLKAAA